MLETLDQNLREWVGKTLGGVTFSLTAPVKEATGSGVNIYLLELVDSPPRRGPDLSPLQFDARYLVTTWADTPEAAHQMLEKLAFAALEKSDFNVEFYGLPADLWNGLGIPPQPAFLLRLTVRQERPQPEVHYVHQPLELRIGPSTLLRGVVRSSQDIPIAGAQVEMPSIQRSTRTDENGNFLFANIPKDLTTYQIKIRAKGREQIVTVAQQTPDQAPVVIRFDPVANP